MRIGDIVLFYHYDYGEPEIAVGLVVLESLVGPDDLEWFDISYKGMGTTLYTGLYEEEVISCLGPDTLDELVMM